MNNILLIKNLYKSFHKGSYVLEDINISINKNECFCLLGASGSGKSTLAKCVLRLIPYEGEIYFNNIPINTIKDYPKYVSFIPQDPMSSINPNFKVIDALLEPIKILSLAFNKNNVLDIIKNVGIKEELLDKKVKTLSGGERQRVAIARAIITNPTLIVADEPTSSVDAIHKSSISELFLRIKQDSTLFVITHDIYFSNKICDKIGIMYRGKIVELRDKDEIFHNPLHPFTKELLDDTLNCKAYV